MRRQPLRLAVGAALGLLLLAAVIVGLQVLRVRSDLAAATHLAAQVQRTALAGDSPDLGPLRTQVHRAAAGSRGWLWRVAEWVPYVGTDLHAVRGSAAALDALTAGALPPLVDAARTARHGGLLHAGQVDLAVLARVHADVLLARPVLEHADRVLRGLHAHIVGGRLAELRSKVARLDTAVRQADAALAQAPALLGAQGDRRYLIAVQNNAEARATGGLIGAVGELDVHHGHVALVRTLTDDQLHNAPKPVPDDPAASRTWVSIGSTLAWFDANLTPNVPDAGRNAAELWHAQTGQQVDGVLFVDAVALQQLVRAPVALPDGRRLAPDEITAFVCAQEYVDYPNPATRKPVLRELAKAIFDGAVSGGGLEPFAKAGSSGHLLAWFARPAEQSLVAGHVMGGALPTDGSAYLQVLTQNFAGDKLDYYLHRTVKVVKVAGGLRVTVELRNDAPTGLPAYVTARADHPVPPVPYGQARVALSLYGGKGAGFTDATLDGKPVQGPDQVLLQVDVDHGLGFATIEVEVPRGRPVVLSVLLHGPAGLLTYRQQPLVRPDQLDLQVPHRVVGS